MAHEYPLGPTLSRATKVRIWHGFFGLCLSVSAGGCDSDWPSISTTADPLLDSVSTSTVDSCAVALAPHESANGTAAGTLDRRIADHHRVLSGTVRDALPHLERLGWAYVGKARETLDAGYYTLALQTSRCMDSWETQTPEALLLRGHALHNLHRFSQAAAVADHLVAVRGRWFDHGLLGDTLLELGRFDDAVRAYQAMMDERPGPEAYARAARVRWLVGDVAGAADMMTSAVRSMGQREKEPLAWALVELARYQRLLGRNANGQRSIEQALHVRPQYPPALLEKGRRLLAEGRASAAVPILRRAERLNPHPESQWSLLEALEQSGAPGEAAVVNARLAESGARLDRRTFSLFLATRGLQPRRALLLSAEELTVRRDVYTLDAHAWALLASGSVSEALHFSRRAVATGIRDARLFYHAGAIHARAGEVATARRWLHRARDLERSLLPSERNALGEEIAALEPRTPPRMAAIPSTGNIH